MAAREMVWNFEAQGIPYRVEFQKNQVSINNAEPVKLKQLTKKSNLLGTDYSMMIEGKEAVLHIRSFSAPVLSYDGRDCATGEEYIPAKVPVWTWVFVILHAIDFFLLIGGALGGAIQAIVILLIAAIASNPKIPTGARVLLCAGIWLLSSVLQYFLASWLAVLLY